MDVTVTKSSGAFVPQHTTRAFGPGQVCLDAVAGDIGLVRDTGFVAKAIRGFERLRVPKPFCWTNHAFVVLNDGPDAQIVQETAKGSIVTPLADLVKEPLTISHFEPNEGQLDAGLKFLAMTLGTGYGYLTIPADAFNALTGLELSLAIGNRMVCSTQTCRFLERLGLVPDCSPYAVTPAHLAWYLDVFQPRES